MSNTYGKFYGYTGLFPILKNDTCEVSHAIKLRKLLSNLPNDGGSLFSRTGLVHGARFFVLGDVVYNSYPSVEEHLEYEYLVVSMTFDGCLEILAQRLAKCGESELQAIFEHCYGFSSVVFTAGSILSFLHAGQVTTSFLYVEADGDLEETLRALLAQKCIAEMLAKAQFLDAKQKKELVRATINKISSATLPVAGNFVPTQGSEP